MGKTALFVFTALPLLAQTHAFVQQPFSVRVSLDVDAPVVYVLQLRSCLAREMRALQDVIITTREAPIQVSVIALEDKHQNESLGFATAVLVTQDGRAPWHGLQLGPDLAGVCAMIAADIDQKAIEPAREAWQARQDLTPDKFIASEPATVRKP